MRRALDRERIVKKHARARNNTAAVAAIIAFALRQTAHGIRAVKRIIKTAPTGIRRVQREPRIGDRHNQLWPRNAGNFRINIGRINREIIAFGDQITNLAQKRLVSGFVVGLADARTVPVIDLALQFFPTIKQGFVFWSKVMDQA